MKSMNFTIKWQEVGALVMASIIIGGATLHLATKIKNKIKHD